MLEDGDMGNSSRWRESLLERTVSRKNANLMQLVYGTLTPKSLPDTSDQPRSSDDESEDDEFFRPKGEGSKVCENHFRYVLQHIPVIYRYSY